ncbi:hypothetical protein [Jannaschia sp. W003]|uniref:hypothetical protein n=1 Tax=Jannaschia sp. W003 TaxID=2867012 RepID=UPI0021A2EE1B|nr:hypothetical protein [Jannaschia sp. W003]UWQ20349.1 hypothetical protein K3554_10105 [Jannaschia sp. W003]
MTAIDGLERLETTALWRPAPDAEARAVYVSIGEAELRVFGDDEAALSHWSLPAIRRLNPGVVPARYAPGGSADEELSIDESAMIDALERVLAAVERGRPHPGRLRWLLVAAALGIGGLVAAFWMPSALRERAAVLLPPVQREEIGDRLLTELSALTGPPCTGVLGQEALDRLRERILPTTPVRLRVVRDLPIPALALPGDILLVSNETLLAQDDPAIAAGHVLATRVSAAAAPPLAAFLEGIGLRGIASLLTSGQVPPVAYARHIESLLLDPPALAPASVLRPAFSQARLDWAPWAAAVGLDAGSGAGPGAMPPALDDTDWQSLRGICE